jgi:hypothetical protein
MIPPINNWCLWKYKNMNIRHIHLHFTPIQEGNGIEKCFSFQHLTSEKQEVQNTSRQPYQLYKVMHSCYILSCIST